MGNNRRLRILIGGILYIFHYDINFDKESLVLRPSPLDYGWYPRGSSCNDFLLLQHWSGKKKR